MNKLCSRRYSRRIRFKPLTRVILFTGILMAFLFYCERKVSMLPEEYHIQNTKNYAQTTISDIVADELIHIKQTYEITETSDEKLSYMEINSADLATIKSELTQKINDGINNSKVFFIPIGSLLDYNLLNGYGFSVPVNMRFVGSAKVEINTKLVSGGINQSVYILTAVVEAEIATVSMKSNVSTDFYSAFPLCEVYISGDVPSLRMNTG